MREICCYHCRAVLESEGHCPACGVEVDSELAHKITAARALEANLEADADVDIALRLDLLETTRRHITRWLDRAEELAAERRAAAAAAVEPPAVVPPLPPPPAAATASPPPIPESVRRGGVPELRRDPIWKRLGPVFAENILFTLAVFLLVGGAVYFVTTAWTTMAGTERLLVVFGGVEVFGLLLWVAGRALNRAGTLVEIERTLTIVNGFLVPIVALVAGRLLNHSLAFGLPIAALALWSGWFAAAKAGGLLHSTLARSLPITVVGISALCLFAPWASVVHGWTGVVAAAMTMFAVHRLASRADGEDASNTWWIAAALTAFAGLAVVSGSALDASGPWFVRLAPVGVVFAAMGWCAVRIEHSVGRSPAALVVALALALTGCVVAGGDMRLLLAAAFIATWTAARAAFRIGRPAAMWPALVLSVVTYFLLPAPVRELAMELRAWFAGSLGYEPERLPISFYGITFLPYTAVLALYAFWLRRRGLAPFATIVLSWCLAVATGLAVLSVVAGVDARAPMAVLGAEGALLCLLGAVTRRRRLLFAGILGLFGGLVSALVHLEASVAAIQLALAAGGLATTTTAARLQRGASPTGFRLLASWTLLDAALAAAAAASFVALSTLDASAGATSAGAHLALAALVGLLSWAYRASWFAPLAWFLAGAAAFTFADVGSWSVPWLAMLAAAASAAPLMVARFVAWRPSLSRPGVVANGGDASVTVIVSMAALQLLGAPAVVAAIETLDVSWLVPASLALDGALLFVAALWSGYVAVPVIGAAQVFGAALLGVAAAGREFDGFSVAAACAVGALLITVAERLASLRPRGRELFVPVFTVVIGGVAVAVVTSVVQRLGVGLDWPLREDALIFVITAAATLVVSVVAWMRTAGAPRTVAGLVAVVSLPLLPIALCDATRADAAWYPLSLVLAAATARVVGGRRGATVAVYPMALAIVVASVVAATDLTGDFVLVLAFGSVAFVGRLALGPHPVLRSFSVLFGALGAVWFGLTISPLAVTAPWLAAVVWTAGALAVFAPRVGWLGVERVGATWFVAPIAVSGLLIGLAQATVVLATGISVLDDPELIARDPVSAAAVALVILGLAVGVGLGHRRGVPFAAAFAVVASFIRAPVTALFAEVAGVHQLPDVEVALIALALALAAGRDVRRVAAYLTGAVAVLLTALQLQHPSTPLAFLLAATAVPVVLAIRDRATGHLEVAGWGVMATSFVTALWFLGEPAGAATDVLPLLGGIAGFLAAVYFAVEWVCAQRRIPGLVDRFGRLASGQAVVAVLLVVVHAMSRIGVVVDGVDFALVLGAMILVAISSVGRAVLRRTGWPLYVAVAAVLALYSSAALRTELLTPFDGYHLHVILLLGAGLLFLSRPLPAVFARPMIHVGLALPMPAVVFFGTRASIDGALALFLAASVYGYAALVFRRPTFCWLSASLLNGAVFSLWQHYGIVDPAFYGVPAGLTLAIGSELVRQSQARFVLWSSGLVLLYGSIAIQVVRVEEPAHALALFVGGLLAVIVGFLRKRTDFLVAGTAAVVVDVVGYLVRHGLENDFVGAALLVGSGLTVLVVAVISRRRRQEIPG